MIFFYTLLGLRALDFGMNFVCDIRREMCKS